MSQLANSMTKLGRRGEDAEAHAHTQGSIQEVLSIK